jgi:small subunit ribosomal protein S6e
MPFKINISEKSGKTYKLELESEDLNGKELHDKIPGKEILPALEGYEFEITGASDKAGFPSMENVDGISLKKVLLTYGKGFKKRPRKEGKKKYSKNKPKGLRLRKTVRGKVLSPDVIQINMKVLKAGHKHLAEIFPDQNKAPEKQAEAPKQE